MFWRLIFSEGMTVLAAANLVMYWWFWPVDWLRMWITTFFLLWFGGDTWLACRDFRWITQEIAHEQAGGSRYRYEQLSSGLYGWMRILALVGMLLLVGSVPASAMACTTHTYWVDGRYVMCQTCCTNGMCNTTCF